MYTADGEQHNSRLEAQLWLLSGLVQSSRETQNAALRCLPNLVSLLDEGMTLARDPTAQVDIEIFMLTSCISVCNSA